MSDLQQDYIFILNQYFTGTRIHIIVLEYDVLSVGSLCPFLLYNVKGYNNINDNDIFEMTPDIDAKIDSDGMAKLFDRKSTLKQRYESEMFKLLRYTLGFSPKSSNPNTNIETLDYHLNKLTWLLIRLFYFEENYIRRSYTVLMDKLDCVIGDYNYRYLISDDPRVNNEEQIIARKFIYLFEDLYEVGYRNLFDSMTLINYSCWNLVTLPMNYFWNVNNIAMILGNLLCKWNTDSDYQRLLRESFSRVKHEFEKTHTDVSDTVIPETKIMRKRKRESITNTTKLPNFNQLIKITSFDWKQAVGVCKGYLNLDDWITNAINGEFTELKRKWFHPATVNELMALIAYSSKFDNWQRIVSHLVSHFFTIKTLPRRISIERWNVMDELKYNPGTPGQIISKLSLNSTVSRLETIVTDHPILLDIYNPKFDSEVVSDIISDTCYPSIDFKYDDNMLYSDLNKIIKKLNTNNIDLFHVNSIRAIFSLVNVGFKALCDGPYYHRRSEYGKLYRACRQIIPILEMKFVI